MQSRNATEGPLSFLGVTIRRSFVSGRPFLIYGMVISTLLGLGLGATGGAAFTDAFPLLLPIFTVVGGMGALMVFSNDRMKGVLEYLMAYGVGPRRLFMNVLIASLILVTVILVVVVGVSTGAYLARGNSIPVSMWEFMLVYSLPMSYGSTAFATTLGMYWTAISSPRMGLSSPTGFAPFIGILPSVATLLSITAVGIEYGSVSESSFLLAGGLAIGLVAGTVVVLLSMVSRLLRRERLLSPA